MTFARAKAYRWTAMMLALLLLLAACNGEDPDDVTLDDEEPAPAETPEDEPEEEEEAPEEAPDEVEGEEVTLNLGHPFPAGHLIQVNALEPWADEVAEATDGTVTVEIHPGGALVAPDTAYDNAAAGAVELGWALHGYTPGRFPLTDAVELPFLFENAEVATNALWDLWEEFPELQEEYGDVEVLGLWTHDVGNLYTRERPVASPEELSGLSLRAPGPIQTNLIEALGGTGVGLPAPELYDSLERGVIDGLMIADTGVESFTLHEVLSYGTHANFYVAGQFLVMNQAAWDGLSESQQQAIESISGRELSLRAARAYDEAHSGVLGMYDDWGMEILTVEGDDVEQWREVAQPVIDDWIQAREDEGLPGQAMYDFLAGN